MVLRQFIEIGPSRKPDPGFYLVACERNGIEPQDAVFLDDIRLWVLLRIKKITRSDVPPWGIWKVLDSLEWQPFVSVLHAQSYDNWFTLLDVPIGQTLAAVKRLEDILGMDLTTESKL